MALSGPAAALNVRWEPDALAAAAATAQGYPYTLQLIGDAAWAAAGRPDPGAAISAAHLAQARQAVQTDLTALFRARWEKATPLEQAFMKAMAAQPGSAVRRSAIAANMGVDSDRLGVPRARLLDKGLIDVVGRSELEFRIPGFADFVRSHSDLPAGHVAPVDRWADVCALIDPRILDDPHWPTLAGRLDAIADTGQKVTALLRRAVADRTRQRSARAQPGLPPRGSIGRASSVDSAMSHGCSTRRHTRRSAALHPGAAPRPTAPPLTAARARLARLIRVVLGRYVTW